VLMIETRRPMTSGIELQNRELSGFQQEISAQNWRHVRSCKRKSSEQGWIVATP